MRPRRPPLFICFLADDQSLALTAAATIIGTINRRECKRTQRKKYDASGGRDIKKELLPIGARRDTRRHAASRRPAGCQQTVERRQTQKRNRSTSRFLRATKQNNFCRVFAFKETKNG